MIHHWICKRVAIYLASCSSFRCTHVISFWHLQSLRRQISALLQIFRTARLPYSGCSPRATLPRWFAGPRERQEGCAAVPPVPRTKTESLAATGPDCWPAAVAPLVGLSRVRRTSPRACLTNLGLALPRRLRNYPVPFTLMLLQSAGRRRHLQTSATYFRPHWSTEVGTSPPL